METFRIVPNNINNASTAPDFIKCGRVDIDCNNKIALFFEIINSNESILAIIDLNTYSIFKQ